MQHASFIKNCTKSVNLNGRVTLATHACPVIICGDLNVHVDQADNPNAARLHQLLELLGYSQHVHEQTHKGGHTLELVMIRSETDVSDGRTGPYISDHALICFSLCVKKPVADQLWTTSRTCVGSLETTLPPT